MNREIMFRGRQTHTGEWIEGSLIDYNMPGVPHRRGIRERYYGAVCSVVPETVSQFSGLHDKNGKEAYFDDIVQFPFSLPPFDGTNVKWHTGVIGVDEYGHSCIMVGDERFHIQGVLKGEVIGSIHDLKTE